MEQPRWFRCEREQVTSCDGLQRLRRAMLRLYQDGTFIHYGLMSVVVPATVSGFDRLAARLDCSRLVAEQGFTDCATLTDHGPVMALWRIEAGWETAMGDLRERLAMVGPGDHRPSLCVAPLPADTADALELLTELSSR